MAEVTIRRCMVRVVRHGGWSWGPQPRRLVADAVSALPALLAAELERLLPAEAEGEIAAPLRLSVHTGLPELGAWAERAAREAQGDAGRTGAIPEALRRALVAEQLPARLTTAQPDPARPEPQAAAPRAQARAAVILDLLTAWRATGALEALLDALPDEAVVAWHRAVLELGVEAPGRGASPGPSLEALLAPLAERATSAAPPARLRLRLRAAVELAASAGLPPTTPEARAAIDMHLPPARAAGATPLRGDRPSTAPSGARRAVAGTEVRVASALPFLLLGPLHRTGWLDVLDATLAAAGLESRLPALAVALATKVLPEPERGWRRTPATVAAAAAFAGNDEPPPDAEVADLARVAAPLAPALDAAVRRPLLDGRRAGDPLVLCAAGAVFLLVDPEGAFLLAHADDPEAAAARASEFRAPVFVPADDAEPRLLAALDRADVAFVTPAAPVRGEPWQPVPGTRAPRLYSNRALRGFRRSPRDVVLRAQDTWREIERRPLPGRPNDPALGRSLALAAALALGTIAWELWRQREPTDAALALARFGDLEGTVRFDEDRVRVRLPLGKRFRDLEGAGFLEDVPRVPWLGFRPVVFSGG